jgi:hypothetical protein
MASGASTKGGWDALVTQLNTQFEAANIGNFATKFKNAHGADGNGNGVDKPPYKFGQFVDRHGGLLSGTALGQFLIDSGKRHWEDTSLDNLEYTIKRSLTQATPKKIVFNLQPAPAGATKARAEITDQSGKALKTYAQIDSVGEKGSYKVTIWCPTNNPRPAP